MTAGMKRARRVVLAGAVPVALVALAASGLPGDAASAVPRPCGTVTGPVTITAGGTYQVCARSGDPKSPAVTVATTASVTLHGFVEGPGDLILGTRRVNLTVTHMIGVADNPNVRGLTTGQFIATDGGFANLDVEHSTFGGGLGIWAHGYAGNRTAAQTLEVLDNRATNINGRRSDGAGGWLATAESPTLTQFLQLDQVLAVPHIEVAWNRVTNAPGRSRVEDNVNFFRSGGTRASPADVHDNFIDGAYPARATSQPYTGGGILIGDTGGTSQAGSWVNVHDNVIVATTSYGISVAFGCNDKVTRNRIVSSGKVNGVWVRADNVGLALGSQARRGVPCSASAANTATRNVIGWQRRSGRNDTSCPTSPCPHNTALAGPVTAATERAEQTSWDRRAAAAGVTAGAG
jgi:hypothetical protein